MKFSSKLTTAAFSKKVPSKVKVSSAMKEFVNRQSNSIDRSPLSSSDPSLRMFNSLSRYGQALAGQNEIGKILGMKDLIFPFSQATSVDKDASFGRLFYSTDSSNGSVKKTDTSVILDFPQLLEVLPCDVKKSKVINFPFLNPWRMKNVKSTTETDKNAVLPESESDVQQKRRSILEKQFPVKSFPSVTRILQSTMDEASVATLSRWKENMIAELGEVGFIQHQRKLFYRGSVLHSHISKYLLEMTDKRDNGTTDPTTVDVPEEISGFWKSLSSVFQFISQVQLIEKRINHPFLCYSGVADCVAEYDGQTVLIDWKTSSKPKRRLEDLYDEPIQAAAYAGALNYDPGFLVKKVPASSSTLPLHVDKFVVIVAYESGEPATAHTFNHTICKEYWGLWLSRMKKYWDSLDESKMTAKAA